MDHGNSNIGQRRSIASRGVAFFRESLRDSDRDYTKGPIRRALGLLAIPMMLEMSMESIFAVVDIAFVSRLGTDAIAPRQRASRRRCCHVGAGRGRRNLRCVVRPRTIEGSQISNTSHTVFHTPVRLQPTKRAT